MIIRIIICLILLVIGHKLFAQPEPSEEAQPTVERKASHYIGIQANQLIRQLLSFGGNSAPVTNPYLITYSVNSMKNGVGFSTGIGLSSIQTKATDNFTAVTSKTNDFALRAGIEKKTYLSKRWLAGYGFDLLAESNKTETVSDNGTTPNPTVTTTINRQGFGPRITLNYQFNKKLLIGSEASYYMKWIRQKQKITGLSSTPTPNANLHAFSFTLPAVVFLIVKV